MRGGSEIHRGPHSVHISMQLCKGSGAEIGTSNGVEQWCQCHCVYIGIDTV